MIPSPDYPWAPCLDCGHLARVLRRHSLVLSVTARARVESAHANQFLLLRQGQGTSAFWGLVGCGAERGVVGERHPNQGLRVWSAELRACQIAVREWLSSGYAFESDFQSALLAPFKPCRWSRAPRDFTLF